MTLIVLFSRLCFGGVDLAEGGSTPIALSADRRRWRARRRPEGFAEKGELAQSWSSSFPLREGMPGLVWSRVMDCCGFAVSGKPLRVLRRPSNAVAIYGCQ